MSVKSIDSILNVRVLTKKRNVNHRTRVESEETVPVCKFLLGTRIFAKLSTPSHKRKA